MDRSHDGAKRPAKRPWAQPMTVHSVRLTREESRLLNDLVRKLRMSQSKVLAYALRHVHEAEAKKAA